MAEEDYYELLDVPPDATADQIREAVAVQRRYWTSLVNHRDRERQYEAQRSLDKLEQAYETLSDPARRASYDHNRAKGRQDAPASKPAQPIQEGVCPHCETENSPTDRHCGGCGRDLQRACPNCGADMFITIPFCRRCGSSYEETVAALERQAVEVVAEAETAIHEAERAKVSLNQTKAQHAAEIAQDAAQRAQDAARRAGTQRAKAAAAKVTQAAARVEVLGEETVKLIEERARRRDHRVLGLVLALIVLAFVLSSLTQGSAGPVIWWVLLVLVMVYIYMREVF